MKRVEVLPFGQRTNGKRNMVEYLYTMRTLSKDLYPFKSGAEAADSAYTNKGFQYLLEAMSSAKMA